MNTTTVCKKNRLLGAIKKNYLGYLFVSPLIAGILIFTFYPMVSSLYYSFFDYDLINPPENFGLQNYENIFVGGGKTLFWKAMGNTIFNGVITIPCSMTLGYFLALALKKNTRSNMLFRVLYYTPTLIPSVVLGIVYGNILNPQHGILNSMLGKAFGIDAINFFDREHIMASYIVIQLMSVGNGMVIWIAQFNSISETVYEAAYIDGAGKVKAFLAITLPLSSPAIFYNLVTGVIGSFQIFSGPYVLTSGEGGDDHALYFIVMHIYNKAFREMQFSVAAAMSWVLFAIVAVLTVITFKTKKWVHYGEDA